MDKRPLIRDGDNFAVDDLSNGNDCEILRYKMTGISRWLLIAGSLLHHQYVCDPPPLVRAVDVKYGLLETVPRSLQVPESVDYQHSFLH